LDRLRDEEASSIWAGLMRGRLYVLVLPTAITRVRSSTITPYLPIRVLFVLPRPWPPELPGSLRDLAACSCRCCWLLAALAGTEWWAHVQLSCSLDTCCRGSRVVSLVVKQLPILRRFSEATVAPTARAEAVNACTAVPGIMLGYRCTGYRLSSLMRYCLMPVLRMAGHGVGLQKRTMHQT
jgi:hypothetical protein